MRGWGISGVTEVQSGLPLTVTQNNATGGFTQTQRPNQIASAVLPGGSHTLAQWFNTSAFVSAPAFTAGDEARFSFFGPRENNWDMALMRNFTVRERLILQFRAEFYNALNHPNFKNPNTTLGSQTFGAITADNSPRITELGLRLFF